MFHPKPRRAFAAAIVAVCLFSVQPAGAAPGASGDREGSRFSVRISRYERSAWDFLAGLMQKITVAINPDGNH